MRTPKDSSIFKGAMSISPRRLQKWTHRLQTFEALLEQCQAYPKGCLLRWNGRMRVSDMLVGAVYEEKKSL